MAADARGEAPRRQAKRPHALAVNALRVRNFALLVDNWLTHGRSGGETVRSGAAKGIDLKRFF